MKTRTTALPLLLATLACAGALALSLPGGALACTGIYVGKDATVDGSIIIARSSDNMASWPNRIVVIDDVRTTFGDSIPVGEGMSAPIPEKTYRYAGTPWCTATTDANGLNWDTSVATNECGVSMTMAITAFSNERALAADPMVEGALDEQAACDLVICQSATAREAAEKLARIVDEYGSAEQNIAIISDRDEVWYAEIYTGHQYAMVKLPDDCASVFGNEYCLHGLEGYAETICSEGLESVPAAAGFAVYDASGQLDLSATYAAERVSYSHMRTWIGHQVLAPSVFGGDYSATEEYPLAFRPDGKVSVIDVMELLRNRYDGTAYDPDTTGRIDMRVIGTETCMSAHIVQTHPELPADMACVLWESTASPVYGVFVPLSNLAAEASASSYGRDVTGSNDVYDIAGHPWYACKALNALCAQDPRVYGAPVRAYWHDVETRMVEAMGTALEVAADHHDGDRDAVRAYLTKLCASLQDHAFDDEKQLYNEVLEALTLNTNALKLGRNPETHEYLSTERVLDPIEVKLDAAAYSEVEAFESGGGSALPAAIGLAVVAVAAVAALLVARQRRRARA